MLCTELTLVRKCDGTRPKCSYCEDLNFDCVYLQSASSSNVIVGKEYLGSLEDRLKLVEESIKSLQSGQGRPHKQLRFEEDDEQNVREDGINSLEATRSGHRRDGVTEVDSGGLQEFVGLEDETDGMGAIVFIAEEDCGFFGLRSCPFLKLLCLYPQVHHPTLLLRDKSLVPLHRLLISINLGLLQRKMSTMRNLMLESSVFLGHHLL